MEAITWTYRHPVGIPYGTAKNSDAEAFPGHVRSYGFGMAFQHYLWYGFYTAIHVTPFLQDYINDQKKSIQQGFQLFITLRLGYHIRFFDDHLFIEPSIAFTYWPINTNIPSSFAAIENRWPNYFLFEPGLHIGYKF